MSSTIAIIQARMSSSRLPGKVLLDIAGKPMLAHVVERTRRSRSVSQVVVATTREPADDAIAAFCAQQGYLSRRGSLHDVLDRFYQTALAYQVETVVRITADCPLIDPGLIDLTVSQFMGFPSWEVAEDARSSNGATEPRYDFAANRLPPPWGRTYPIGLDTEVCTFQALERAWKEAASPYQREHVMPYLYEDSPVIDSRTGQVIDGPRQVFADRHPFQVLLVNHDENLGQLRWTVDTPSDLALVRSIFASFPGRDDISWQEVLALVRSSPEISSINAGVQHKTAFDADERG
jgi:spore coat polysaccharide biosynthesis protein SpsF